MLHTIVVPIDESPWAAQVVPFVVPLAQASGCRLVLVQVIADEQVRPYAEGVLEHFRARIPSSVSVDSVIRQGAPASSIVQVAREEHADLLVMVTEHATDVDRWLNGSVTDDVLRHMTSPILVVPAAARPWHSQERRILVPLDGSLLAERAVEPAAELAQLLSASVLLVQTTDTPDPARLYLDAVAQRLTERGVVATTCVLTGEPAPAIVNLAAQQDVDLLAMATHGRTGWARLAAGSVATRTLQLAGRPVLLTRPAALIEQQPEAAAAVASPVAPLPWIGG